MTTADRSRCTRLACVAAILIWAANAGPATAQEGPPPPSSVGVCPEIEEDGLLCSADLLSGNCADFVPAADRLGALYRSELEKLPDSQASLLSTTWWGCGPGTLADIAALLVRIGSPPALAVLKTQPYAGLVVAQAPPSPPAQGAPPAPPACDDLSTPLQRNACIGAQLQAARAENQSVFARCQSLVVAGLRDDFVDSQSSFQSLLPVRCDTQVAGVDDKSMKTFVRSRCLVQALTDNTHGMLAAHPECQTPN